MSFIRVRATSGPLHEFYAASEEVAVNPDLYHVLDREPVDIPGEVVYVETPAPQVASRPVRKSEPATIAE